MKTHELKTAEPMFMAVLTGRKTFEHRLNDRDFKTGDTVVLQKLDAAGVETGIAIAYRVGFVLREGEYGVAPGYCVFSLLTR